MPRWSRFSRRILLRQGWGALLSAIALAGWTSLASAQTEDAKRTEARQHFQQGIELAEDGRYQQALDQFLAAHRLTGNYAVLYNIAQSHIALRDPLAAIVALEQYLAAGAGQLDPKRVEEVQLQLATLKAELAELKVLSSVQGSELNIDGRPVGRLPLSKPLWLSPGNHEVQFSTAEGPVLRTVVLSAGERLEIRIEPPAPVAALVRPSTLTVECTEPVQVWVDGTRAQVPAKNTSVALEHGNVPGNRIAMS